MNPYFFGSSYVLECSLFCVDKETILLQWFIMTMARKQQQKHNEKFKKKTTDQIDSENPFISIEKK